MMELLTVRSRCSKLLSVLSDALQQVGGSDCSNLQLKTPASSPLFVRCILAACAEKSFFKATSDGIPKYDVNNEDDYPQLGGIDNCSAYNMPHQALPSQNTKSIIQFAFLWLLYSPCDLI